MRRTGIILGIFFLLGALLARAGAAEERFDARRAQTGRFVYRMVQDGKPTARFTLIIASQADGNFRFTGESAGVDQKWESVATASFHPISAALQMKRRNGDDYAMELKYANGRVDGATRRTTTAAPEAPVTHTSQDTVRADTIDQRIDWAAALCSRLEPDSEITFTVYDPETGVSKATAKVLDEAECTVSTGTYAAVRISYRIDKSGGSETYEVFVTRAIPRVMLKEKFPNGMVTELVEMEAAVPSR